MKKFIAAAALALASFSAHALDVNSDEFYIVTSFILKQMNDLNNQVIDEGHDPMFKSVGVREMGDEIITIVNVDLSIDEIHAKINEDLGAVFSYPKLLCGHVQNLTGGFIFINENNNAVLFACGGEYISEVIFNFNYSEWF